MIMKRMGKMISIFMLVVLLGAMVLPFAASADVIYTPFDSFYEENYDVCDIVNRSFTAAGPNGNVTLYESPESAQENAVIANGEVLHVSVAYTDADGITWGCAEQWDKDIMGWAPMDYLTVVYDGISFDEEFGHLFEKTEAELSKEYRGKTIYFWKYPGSQDFIDFEIWDDGSMPTWHEVYTDAEGRTWGKCPYHYGVRGYWICLDDPLADYDTIFPEPVETEPVTEIPEPQDEVAEIVPKENWQMKIIVTVAVAIVVSVTAVLLFVLKKEKQE